MTTSTDDGAGPAAAGQPEVGRRVGERAAGRRLQAHAAAGQRCAVCAVVSNCSTLPVVCEGRHRLSAAFHIAQLDPAGRTHIEHVIVSTVQQPLQDRRHCALDTKCSCWLGRHAAAHGSVPIATKHTHAGMNAAASSIHPVPSHHVMPASEHTRMCCWVKGGGAPSYVVLRQSPHCIFSSGGTFLNSVALNAGVDLAGAALRRLETCTYARS
jgi:hypothetical protein